MSPIQSHGMLFQGTVSVDCPCFELKRIELQISNPLHESGQFQIFLTSNCKDLLDDVGSHAPLMEKDKGFKRDPLVAGTQQSSSNVPRGHRSTTGMKRSGCQ